MFAQIAHNGLYKKRRAIDKHYRFGLCLADFVKIHNFGVNTKALCFLYLVRRYLRITLNSVFLHLTQRFSVVLA